MLSLIYGCHVQKSVATWQDIEYYIYSIVRHLSFFIFVTFCGQNVNFACFFSSSVFVTLFPPFLHRGCCRLQRGKKHQIENGSGAEDNGDSSHCSNASVHSNQEAGPSIKRTKTSDDSGLDMDNATENGGGELALDGASEIELVFRAHPTLMEKEDTTQTRWVSSVLISFA